MFRRNYSKTFEQKHKKGKNYHYGLIFNNVTRFTLHVNFLTTEQKFELIPNLQSQIFVIQYLVKSYKCEQNHKKSRNKI